MKIFENCEACLKIAALANAVAVYSMKERLFGQKFERNRKQ